MKILFFVQPIYFAPRLKGLPLELGTGAGSQNTTMIALHISTDK